ncbi:MAG: molybdopterin-binding protein [Marinibacterium sp.]|nr:molybdopterin-binding protein [Marinibacterium sp.]
MTPFNRFVMVDWSGGNDTGPRPRKDAIWACEAGLPPQYLRNRACAETHLAARIDAALAAGERLMIGFDFPFGYPQGFARDLTGQADPLALWDWLDARIEDSPQANNRFDLAGRINTDLGGGQGPFWGNALSRDIAGLPRGKVGYKNRFADRRACETRAKGSFTCWQLSGAGAVGSQMLMGLPVLARLRRRFAGQIAVWPFEPLDRPVAFVEIWPSLIAPVIADEIAQRLDDPIKDAVQVELVARALAALSGPILGQMLDVDAPVEGWILGLGHERALADAARLVPPPLSNDCFALPAGVDWTPVDVALAHLRDALHPVTAPEDVPLDQALGRVLAQPVVAQRSNPPQPNTAVDGYGFAGGVGEGPHDRPLVDGRAAAGVPFDGVVPSGAAIRVLTGAALPEGVDTVILQEDVTRTQGRIAFHGPLKQGANTRRAGEDVTAGDVILPAGRVITPADLALAAATGLGHLPTRAPLRVGVISTGDELIEPGQTAGPGQIFDANRPMLLGLIARFGHVPVDLGRLPDDRAVIRARLDAAARQVDAIVTSGGASAGDEDHVSALLAESGALQHWRIAIKPGRPLALALWNGTPVFGLPGNPVAAMVCTLIFARPALSVLAGSDWDVPQGMDLPAAFSKRKKPGRREYLRARLRDGRVELFASEGSGRISGLSWAEGLVELPDGAAEIAPGDPVRFLPYSAFGL